MEKENISVVKGFQTSVNIAYDLYNEDKVRNFIPTISSLEIFEQVMLSTAKGSGNRSNILIGSYGRGKSHVILVLLSLLSKKNTTIFENILNKMKIYNEDLYNFTNEYILSDKKLMPIIVSGSSTSLTQSFLVALQQSLDNEGLYDLMPDTHFRAALNMIENWRLNYTETYDLFIKKLNYSISEFILKLEEYDVEAYEKFEGLYPSLTSGSKFNPFLGFDVIELYEKVIDKLKTKGFSGVYIIYDEFSKYLESSISNATITDIKLLQDFAEKCERSGDKQMHLMLICHKDIANYIEDNLPKEKVDGWKGVSGRFHHINIHNNFSQMYEIISSVIIKDEKYWSSFKQNYKNRFDDLRIRFSQNDIFDKNDEFILNKAIEGCFPLHPVSTFILPRLSEKVAQNERTLFTFLSSDQKYTLSSFLKRYDNDFSLLTPDYIYDYFEPLFRKEPYTSNIYAIYKITSNILRKIEEKSLGSKIIKTISLLYIIEQFEKLSPTYDVIVETYIDSVDSAKEISKELDELINKECIVYLKRSNNYLKLKETSGINIITEINKEVEKTRDTVSVKDILNKVNFDSYLYPSKYNDDKEMVRYFDFIFINSSELFSKPDWNNKFKDNRADGIILAIIPKDSDEIQLIREVILSQNNCNNIVFVVPNKYVDIDKLIFEYNAVKHLRELSIEDEILMSEFDIYLEDIEEVISNFIFSYTRPEYNGSEYFYLGKKQDIYRRAQLSLLLSNITESIYSMTPIINNEVINKNIVTSVVVTNRNKVVSRLLENELQYNLGLTGTSQDISIMRSILFQTGLLENKDNKTLVNLNPDDKKINHVITLIREFFNNASNGEQNFSELYDKLMLPQHKIGLRLGVIPVFIAVVLHCYKKEIVIKNKGVESKVNCDLINIINDNPQNFTIYLENWDDIKIKYMSDIEGVFSNFVNIKEKEFDSFTYMVLAMNRWYMSLPKYSKEHTSIYLGINNNYKTIDKFTIKFINSIKQINPNPREYLIEKIPTILGYKAIDNKVVNKIKEIKVEYDTAIDKLVKTLSKDIKFIFSKNNNESSLTSVIIDWYESLTTNTKNHLFPNNENRILEHMKTITNDEIVFVKSLCKLITSLRIEDWNSNVINVFIDEVRLFKKNVDDFNIISNDFVDSTTNSYKICFIDKEGSEITKTFTKKSYSNKAKLLLNEINSAIEEMGQSISESEKRQVLIEIIEKLC